MVYAVEHCVGHYGHKGADQQRPVLGDLNNAHGGEEEQTVHEVPHELWTTIDAAVFTLLAAVVLIAESLWCPEGRRQVTKSGGVGHEQANHSRCHIAEGGAAQDHHHDYVRTKRWNLNIVDPLTGLKFMENLINFM